VWWAAGVLVVSSIGGERPIAVLPQMVVPMALLAGIAADGIVRSIDWRNEGRRFAYFAIGAGVLLTNFLIASNHVSTPEPVIPEELALASVAALAIGAGAAVRILGRSAASRYASAVLVVSFWVFSVHTATIVSHREAGNPSDAMTGAMTSPAVRDVRRDVADIVDNLVLDRRPYEVVADPTLGATMQWYLREDAFAGPRPADPTRPAISVSPLAAKPPRGSYAGQRYVVGEVASQAPMTWKGLWRWLIFKEGAGAPSTIEAVVYVRTYPERR
jgi:hypothetical protein